MSYNIKLIRTNNYIEVYSYSKSIRTGRSKNDTTNLNSESDKVEINIEDNDIDKEAESLRRMNLTRKQTKANIVRIIDSNFNNRASFLTLTVKDNITDRKEFSNLFDKFITRMNYNFLNTKKRKLKYLAVLEMQKRGAWHIHMIIFDIGYLKHEKLSKVWGHGFVWINELSNLDNSSNAGRYISKYMEKAIGQELLDSKGKKAYYSSHNLNKPFISKFLLYDKEELNELFNEYNIVYQNEYTAKTFISEELVDNHVIYKKLYMLV